VQDRGERSRSSSPSAPRNSSTSLRLLRILLGGGDTASGKGGVGGVGRPPAVAAVAEAAASVELPSVQAPTVVAARLRRRRRQCLAPVVAAAEDAGMLHMMVTVCILAKRRGRRPRVLLGHSPYIARIKLRNQRWRLQAVSYSRLCRIAGWLFHATSSHTCPRGCGQA
jgi:hypothetical protein